MTEILDSILPFLARLTERLLYYFNGPDGALQALAAAGFFVILLLFIVARRQGFARKGSSALSEPVVLNELVNEAEAAKEDQPDVLAVVEAKRDRQKGEGEENTVTTADGFVFHRRKAKNPKSLAKIEDEDPEVVLAAIEQEMLATRQLFLDGVISRDVYVAQTRDLYEKAQQKM